MYQWEINVRSVLIFWDPWKGKTAIAVVMADDYERIYSNVDIFRDGKQINKRIDYMKDIEKIKFDPKHRGVIIVDEMWVNWNARKSQSQENMDFGKLDMLKRKKNCDVVWIAQLHRMFDVYQRELAQLIIEMQKFGRMFEINRMQVKFNKGNKLWYTSKHRIPILEAQRQLGLSYDQLSESVIKNAEQYAIDKFEEEERIVEKIRKNEKKEIEKQLITN